MKVQRVFEAEYANDRRIHRHRCQCCSKIIKPGEAVLMARIANRNQTLVIHIDHADAPNFPGSPMTWREAMNEWAAK